MKEIIKKFGIICLLFVLLLPNILVAQNSIPEKKMGWWEDARFGCINFPDSDVAYTRKCNYSLCYTNGPLASYIVGYDFPGNNSRMYPVYTSKNKKLFNKYLVRLVRTKNLLSIGRLGLFRYYDMDEAIAWCLDNIDAVENYLFLSPEKRMALLSKVK